MAVPALRPAEAGDLVNGWLALWLLAVAAADLLVIALLARLLGVPFWRVLAVINGAFGTLMIRGPRRCMAEIDVFIDERLSR